MSKIRDAVALASHRPAPLPSLVQPTTAMAETLGMSRCVQAAMNPGARQRFTRSFAGSAPPSFIRPVSTRAAAASSSSSSSRASGSSEAAEAIALDDGSDPDSGSPEMFDNLANIFLKRDQEDWIGLLASSSRWPTLRVGFFARLKQRASGEEDPEEMLRLSRLLRLMQVTSTNVAKYTDLLSEVQDAGPEMWEGMVTQRRPEFATDFFQFIRYKLEALVREQATVSASRRNESSKTSDAVGAQSVSDDLRTKETQKQEMKDARAREVKTDARQNKERDDLALLASSLLTICEAFDEVSKDTETLENAAENFQTLLQVETLEEMNQKIDEMSMNGKLDPALILTAAKAYMSVKESPLVEEEVKDVMAHLYFKMKETMGRQQPKEVRILKHLLAVGEDPVDIRNGLEEAFTPGPELTVGEGKYFPFATFRRLIAHTRLTLSFLSLRRFSVLRSPCVASNHRSRFNGVRNAARQGEHHGPSRGAHDPADHRETEANQGADRGELFVI